MPRNNPAKVPSSAQGDQQRTTNNNLNHFTTNHKAPLVLIPELETLYLQATPPKCGDTYATYERPSHS